MKNDVKKIGIALSGGVDSAVAAMILKNEGHELVGFFLKLWSDPTCQIKGENRCCDYEALEDARSVANTLGIPFYVIDAKEEFKKMVVDYFIEEYRNIRTPNPCVVCNEKIKFDLLLKKALSIGCEKLATGHYARIIQKSKIKDQNEDAKNKYDYGLNNGMDQNKDQSYNLYRLSQEQLSKIIFPLGEMTKKQVRELALKWNLPVKEKAESQEICFFGDSDYRDFLKRYLPAKYFEAGEIVDTTGNIVGRHEGLVNYTIGQRRGIDQKTKNRVTPEYVSESQELRNKFGMSEKQPLYVVGYDLEKNQLIVGEDKDTYKKMMDVSDIHWINPSVDDYELVRFVRGGRDSDSITVKIRSQAKAVKCQIKFKTHNAKNKSLEVEFDTPQRAITPGQSAVFYRGDEVIGGGIIR